MCHTLMALGNALFSDDVITSYKYVVQISRRCFLAGFLWRQDHSRHKGVVFTSEVGIYSYIDAIARTYIHGASPARILIEDDFLIHGAALGRMVEELVEAITRSIAPNGYEERRRIRREILNHIDIRVYAANHDSLLLATDVAERVRPTEVADLVRWRNESIRFVRDLATRGVVNSTNVLSAYLDSSEPDVNFATSKMDGWSYIATNYGKYSQCKDQEFFRMNALQTGSIFAVRKVSRRSRVYLLPSFHHGSMSRSDVYMAANAFIKCVYQRVNIRTEALTIHRAVVSALEVENLVYRVAFLDMLLCQMGLSVFLEDAHVSQPMYNTLLVADFFGCFASRKVLDTLISIKFGRSDLEAVYRSIPRLDLRIDKPKAEAQKRVLEHDVFMATVRASYRLALANERTLQGLQQKRARLWHNYDDWRHRWNDSVDLTTQMPVAEWCEFARECADAGTQRPDSISINGLDYVMASIDAMSDEEQLNTTYVASGERGRGRVVAMEICPTEMSLSILPSIIDENLWDWFKRLVKHCRAYGTSIFRSMQRLGFRRNEVSPPGELLADVAIALDGRSRLDQAVLDWDAGVRLS